MAANYITFKELSERTGIKQNTLYVWIKVGKIRHRREKRRIYVEDLDASDILYNKTCPNCNSAFLTVYNSQVYCDKRCSSRFRSRKWARKKKEAAR